MIDQNRLELLRRLADDTARLVDRYAEAARPPAVGRPPDPVADAGLHLQAALRKVRHAIHQIDVVKETVQ